MSNPTCSHCGYEFDNEETWESGGEVYYGDGDLTELVCPNLDCNKTFYVICRHEITWEKCDEDGDRI